VRGRPISAPTYDATLEELRTMQWPGQRHLPRERPFVKARDYFTLNRRVSVYVSVSVRV
jgi:hypothetical protein